MNKLARAFDASAATRADQPDEILAELGEYDTAGDQSNAIDLVAIWSAIYRNRWLIGLTFAICLVGAVVATLMSVPVYRAGASVQVDQRTAKVLGTEDDEASQSTADADRFLQTQVDVLKSRMLSIRVADRLGLVQSKPFLESIRWRPTPVSTSADQRRAVVDNLQAKLDVNLPRNSRVIGVSFSNRDPGLAASVANAYIDEFIESNLQRRFDQSAYARSFLSKQLDQVKARLEQSELAMIGYARSSGLIDASAGAAGTASEAGPRSLTTANLVQLNQSYSTSRSARVEAQQRWEEVRDTPAANLPEVLANPTIQQLTQKRAELQASYQEERQRHKPDYPTVQQAAAALAELNRQINATANSLKATIQTNFDVTRRQEKALARDVDALKNATLLEQDRSVRYNILKREADTNRQLYDGLLQRFKEVSAQSGATTNNVSVIDRAEPPVGPVSPRPMLNLALGVMAALALSGAAVFARERFDDAIHAPQQAETKLGLPLIGTIPRLVDRMTPLEALDNHRSQLAEAHHSISAALDLTSSAGAPTTLFLTSSRQGEGKSTIAQAIAQTYAAAGRTVLLIDADLRKPTLHKIMSISNECGLSTVLAGRADVDQAILATGKAGLSVLPSGPVPPSPAQLLDTESLPLVLETLGQRYQHVIIDGPPVLGLADAPLLASLAGGTIFVVEAGRAHRGAAKAALKRLRRANARLVGVILSKFSFSGPGGAYYSYYSYGAS